MLVFQLHVGSRLENHCIIDINLLSVRRALFGDVDRRIALHVCNHLGLQSLQFVWSVGWRGSERERMSIRIIAVSLVQR
jgi:hypothetical protein